jgi:hypothetical protein
MNKAPSLQDKLVVENTEAIMMALQTAGITMVVVSYSGGGDSGQIEYHDIQGADGYPEDAVVNLNNTHPDFVSYQNASKSIYQTDLRSAIEDMSWIYVNTLNPNFCYSPGPEGMDNDEDGFNYGEVIFDVAKGMISHDEIS